MRKAGFRSVGYTIYDVTIDILGHIFIGLDQTYCIVATKQKHPRCKKSEAKSEAPVSSYSYTRLKSVISGRGKGPSCLLGIM